MGGLHRWAMLTLTVCVCYSTMTLAGSNRRADRQNIRGRRVQAIQVRPIRPPRSDFEQNASEQRNRKDQRNAIQQRGRSTHCRGLHLYISPLSQRLTHSYPNGTTYENFTQGTRVKFLRQWIPAKNWCRSVSRMYHFDNATGQVTVKHAGWYWVYGQVTFSSYAFTNGFKIVTFNSSQHQSDDHHHQHQQQQQQDQEEPITGCIVERARNENSVEAVASTCHVGRVVRLRANQALAVATLTGYYRPMLTAQHLTYWGLYRIN